MGVCDRVILLRGRLAVSFEKTSNAEETDTRGNSSEMDATTFVCHLVSASSKDHPQVVNALFRDIRPENVFLTANGNIKLGSFKVSRLLEEEANYAQTLINSPYYLTPELT